MFLFFLGTEYDAVVVLRDIKVSRQCIRCV